MLHQRKLLYVYHVIKSNVKILVVYFTPVKVTYTKNFGLNLQIVVKIKTGTYLVVIHDSLTTVYELTFLRIGFRGLGIKVVFNYVLLKKTQNYYTFN